MPEVDRYLLDKAAYCLVGGVLYNSSEDRPKVRYFCKMAGITRGQWKRFINRDLWSSVVAPTVSELTIKKLEIIRDHHDNPHLQTLLKMAEAQMEDTST